jgi:ABC-type bacteriocin/lantibiotic exporter with double-glycine peptidase domain
MGLALNSDADWRPSRSRPTCSSPPSTSWLLLRDVALQPVGREAGHLNSALNRRLMMSEPIITFDKVNKWYGNNFHVLRDIDLSVAKGERIVICGPSGSGKSTLIRCINRLEEHQEGTLTWSTASS